MEHRTILLYLSVVLNLILSTMLAFNQGPSSPSARATPVKPQAKSPTCCPCPMRRAPEHGSHRTLEDPAIIATRAQAEASDVDTGADPAFSKDEETPATRDHRADKPETAIQLQGAFEFMHQDCGERAVRPGLFFVDLGANCGNSYALFVRRILPTLQIARKSDILRAFLFEFNPRMHSQFLDSLESRDSRVKVMKAAAHVRDGSFPAYLDNRKESAGQFKCVAKPGAPNPAGASSLLSDMPRAGKPINVTAVDVPAFMRRTFCKGDEIHLKMDIEGFEYTLLTAMIERRVHCLVNTFYIEFHFQLSHVTFMGQNMTSQNAAADARRRLRECSVVREWF